MSSTTDRTSPAGSKRCSCCASNRPLDWFQSGAPGNHGLVGTSMKTCKQCRERLAAIRKHSREAKAAAKAATKAAAKPTEPRPVQEYQLAAKRSTPHLLGRSGTSNSTTTGSNELEKMQHSFEAVKLLDQDEIDAAANLLLELIEDTEDSDDDDDITCETGKI